MACCDECGSLDLRPRSNRVVRYCSRACANSASGRHRKMDEEALFWSHVTKTHHCWLWTGARSGEGNYGYFGFRGRIWRAHRVAWTLSCGPIPSGLFLLHSCDVPECVNPAHLRLGTHKENMRDRDAKGRTASGLRHEWAKHPESILRGENTGSSKLTALTVLEMRRLYNSGGHSFSHIALRFCVDTKTAWNAIRGKTWRHI